MKTNSTISVWLIVIICLVVIGVVCYYAYQWVQKQKNSATNNISSDFKQIVKYFSGNMNTLRDISTSPELSLAKVTFDNIQKIIEFKGSATIKNWYSFFEKDRNSWGVALYKDKAKEMMTILIDCGIHAQEEEQEFVWDNVSSKRYNKLSQIQLGEECRVVAPYWIYNGEIFEKGLVTLK